MPDTILAAIPARGGSVGLPRKNVLPLAGKPLIAYSIEAAQACSRITKTVVSTEDSEIAEIARQYDCPVIDRPAALAGDAVRTHDVVRHMLEILAENGQTFTYVALLQPTSPLRTDVHLERCIDELMASGKQCAMSITEEEHHPLKCLIGKDGDLVPLSSAEDIESPRQALPEAWRPNGAIFVINSEIFLKENCFFVPPVMLYRMDADTSVDVDSELDLVVAEAILKLRQRAP